MWDLVVKALIGLAIGIVAKFLMPGRDPGGCIVTMIIGLIGSLIGGFLSRLIGIPEGGLIGFIMAVVGAIILLVLYRVIIGRRPMP
jgi:uncharacterized membrane protein YeaQ/YmgE (transglycosylase-associated protein family)